MLSRKRHIVIDGRVKSTFRIAAPGENTLPGRYARRAKYPDRQIAMAGLIRDREPLFSAKVGVPPSDFSGRNKLAEAC